MSFIRIAAINFYIFYLIIMFSATGDYNTDGSGSLCVGAKATTYRRSNKYPARIKKHLYTVSMSTFSTGNQDEKYMMPEYHPNNYMPKEYLEMEDKKLLCDFIKRNDIYHPVCELVDKK